MQRPFSSVVDARGVLQVSAAALSNLNGRISQHNRQVKIYQSGLSGKISRVGWNCLIFPDKLQIGSLSIAPATVLAPMAGVTDTVFRRFIRNLGGCGLIMTEFTSSHGVSASSGQKKAARTLQLSRL